MVGEDLGILFENAGFRRNARVMRSLSSVAGATLAKCPRLLALVLSLRLRIWRLRVMIRSRKWDYDFDANRTYWVDPRRIEWALVFNKLGQYDKYRDRGKVIGGDWDRKIVSFTEFGAGVFGGLEDRFVRQMCWEDTKFYRRVLDVISGGVSLWRCRSKKELDDRCKYLDSIFEDIKNNGYKSQSELAGKQDRTYKDEDEVSVRIGRDGALLFEDGQHRLAIAKLLEIDRIPIKITARHSLWHQFRKEILYYARTHEGSIYHALTHPDLSDMPSLYGEERFELIKERLPVESGDLLDIGAHWGYSCHKFEELGFNCYAVESDIQVAYFLRKLRIAENRQFKIILGSIFDYHDKNDFDIVLALNIFHHFIKTEETYYKLIDLLKRLDMKTMFFQPELPDSPQMIGAYRNYDSDEFVDFILENSSLNEAIYIGKTENGRPIYRLRRV